MRCQDVVAKNKIDPASKPSDPEWAEKTVPQHRLAEECRVSQGTISAIKVRRTWRHVNGCPDDSQ